MVALYFTDLLSMYILSTYSNCNNWEILGPNPVPEPILYVTLNYPVLCYTVSNVTRKLL